MYTKINDIFVAPSIRLSKNGDIYEINEEVLCDSTGASISEQEFHKEVVSQISKFFGRKFENIVLLCGAGTSISETQDKIIGKTMRDISLSIGKFLEESDSQYFTIEEVARLCKYLHYDYKSDKFNLEDFMSQMIKSSDFIDETDCAKFAQTSEIILKKIVENTSYSFDQSVLNHHSIINTLVNKVAPPHKLTIATTNYDTLFEEAAELIDCSVIDGFSNSLKPKFDSDLFEWNFVKTIPNIKTRELEYKRKTINLIKLHGSITWEKEGNNIYRKDKINVFSPIIVFPNSNKFMETYSEPYFELFTKFQELLNKQNTLLITSGFSFGDTHLTSMVKRAVLHNYGLSTLVTDICLVKDNSGWKEMGNLLNSNHSIAFLKTNFSGLANYLEGI
jgi:hypothetical protein